MRKIILLILFIAVSTGNSVIAQEGPEQVISDAEVTRSDVSLESVSVLKARLELSQKYNDKILNTIYWSIGTTTALFALLLGSQWFSSYRLAKKDKETLFAHIEESLSEAKQNLKSEIIEKKNDLSSDLQSEIDRQAKAIERVEDLLNKKVAAASEKFAKDLEKLEKEAKYNFAELEFEQWKAKEV